MSETEWKSDQYPLPSDALRAGALRMKVKPGYVVIKRAKTPETYGSGILEIPRAFRDEPMEGEVVAVGPGRPFHEQYCCGLDPEGLFAHCGQLAHWRLVPDDARTDDYAPRIFVCAAHLAEFDAQGMRVLDATRHAWRPCVARPLLRERPLGVKVGDRVVFSKWAGGKQTVLIFGEPLIMTDDVLGVVEGEGGLIIRVEAA